MLKKNGYQERIISKIFIGITNNHSLSQSQLQTQATKPEGEEIVEILMKNKDVYSVLTK